MERQPATGKTPPSDLLPMLARIKTPVFGLEELRTRRAAAADF